MFKRKLYSIFVLLLPMAAVAMDMDDCEIGKTVYIDELFDKKVKVLSCDTSDNTVKVKLKNGDTKWLKVNELMTPFGKNIEDSFELAAMEGLRYLFTEAQKSAAERKKRSGFKVCNRLNDTISVAIASWGNEKLGTHGWYNVETGQCNKILKNALKYNAYYLFIKKNGDKVNSGSIELCMRNDGEAFSITDSQSYCSYPNAYKKFEKIITNDIGYTYTIY